MWPRRLGGPAFKTDKLLSVRLEGAANYGANGWMEYRAREGGAATAPLRVVDHY